MKITNYQLLITNYRFILLFAIFIFLFLSFAFVNANSAIAVQCPGVCQDDKLPCAGGYQSGLCPGAANIRCCLISGTTIPGGSSQSQSITIHNPLGSTKTFAQLIDKIVDWLLIIASTALLPLMIIIGAFQILSAGGDPQKLTSGRHTITYAVIGYALLLLSKGIVLIIKNLFG